MYKFYFLIHTNTKEALVMKILNYIALTLVIIGALNWLLVGIIDFNLVDTLFGAGSVLSRIIYILVGISGIWSLTFYNKVSD